MRNVYEKIKNVKLGIVPKTMEVSVNSEVIMKDKNDFDDLYVVMFNIMDEPLRLSLITIGNLSNILNDRGLTEAQIKTYMMPTLKNIWERL